ncbi:MAG: hypothetical protein ACKOKE_05130 [Actinomycetota bacterium]
MNPLKKFLAILLGSAVVLGATIAFADDSATTDDADEVSIEQTQESTEVESEDVESESDSTAAPGQMVPTGDAWTGDYARGLEVATIARGGEAPAGMESATTAGEKATADAVHGNSADHGPSDSEG